MYTLTPETFHELATSSTSLFFRCLVDLTPAVSDRPLRGPLPRGPLVRLEVVTFYEGNYYMQCYCMRHDQSWSSSGQDSTSYYYYDKVTPDGELEDEEGQHNLAQIIRDWSSVQSWNLIKSQVVMIKEPMPVGSPMQDTHPLPDFAWVVVMHVMRMWDRLTHDIETCSNEVNVLPREVQQELAQRIPGVLRELFNRRASNISGII